MLGRCQFLSQDSHVVGLHAVRSGRTIVTVVCKSTKGGAKVTTSKAKKPGFRYDGANQRWVRDDKNAELAWDNTTVQPLSGPEYTVWPVMHTVLKEKNLKSVDPDEAFKMAKKGVALIDVRVAQDYEKCHAEGAISVPLYKDVEGTEFFDTVKKIAYAALALRATERDTKFAEKAAATINKNKKVLVMCAVGGTLETQVTRVTTRRTKVFADPDRAFGRESRSLKACYELVQAGFKDVVHVKGGLSQWRYDGLPVESS